MSLRDLDTEEVAHHHIKIIFGEAPIQVAIPPRTVHRLTAITATGLLIAATGSQGFKDTVEAELPESN